MMKHVYSPVIPGRPTGADPESRTERSQNWIPGSRFTRPGMTKREIDA